MSVYAYRYPLYMQYANSNGTVRHNWLFLANILIYENGEGVYLKKKIRPMVR